MALKKKIELENGINLNYHRIVSISVITNQLSIIEVASYINEEQRQKEIDWYKSTEKGDMNVFTKIELFSKEYDKELNVDSAYLYLKTLDKYVDAEDC